MLSVDAIETFYGPVQALFGVSLSVAPGQVVALMGRNGMGKTTTIRSICGLTTHSHGTITFAGVDIAGLPSYRIAQLGLGLVPEGRRCFPNLSVHENLIATARDGFWTLDTVLKLFPKLAERHAQSARVLSGGEQQMLSIGRALMTNPKLVILDEATEGLAPVIRAEIWAAIKTIRSRGQSILIVDKTLKELLPISDRCVILERGKSVWEGTPDNLSAEIRDKYLGV